MRAKVCVLQPSFALPPLASWPAVPALAAPDPEPAEAAAAGDGGADRATRSTLTIDPASDDVPRLGRHRDPAPEKTELLWLNATELKIDEGDGLRRRVRPSRSARSPGGDDFVGLRLRRSPSRPGELDAPRRVHGQDRRDLDAGALPRRRTARTGTSSPSSRRPTRAARFPCFDEPSYKVALAADADDPRGHDAVSNTPIDSESSGAGRRRASCASGRPSPCRATSSPSASARSTTSTPGAAGIEEDADPHRHVPQGKASQGRYAAETTGPLLERLEAYFGMPFPFAKLDQLAIPADGDASAPWRTPA